MSTRMKWIALPVALLLAGTLAMAQSQTAGSRPDPTVAQNQGNPQNGAVNGAQSGQWVTSDSLKLDSKDAATYRETKADPSASGDQAIGIASQDIKETFDGLSRAFANRDLNSIKQSWPSIPDRPRAALQKSFGYFKSVSRNFRPETIDVNGDSAVVIGSYTGSFEKGTTIIPSFGKFHATLRKIGGRWFIDTLLCN